jgi:hypothetical protein
MEWGRRRRLYLHAPRTATKVDGVNDSDLSRAVARPLRALESTSEASQRFGVSVSLGRVGLGCWVAVRRSETCIIPDRPLPSGHDPNAGSGVTRVGWQRGSWPSHILVQRGGCVGRSARPSVPTQANDLCRSKTLVLPP